MMNLSDIQEFIIKRLIQTGGFLVRNNHEDLPFWYTSGRPGPFYVNTQNIVGYPKVEEMLNQIDIILASANSIEKKSENIWKLISSQVSSDPDYSQLVSHLVNFYKLHNISEIDMISGGERRDWFFSIPLSIELMLPHIFLFKSGLVTQCNSDGSFESLDVANKKVLHVSDIINLASSYFKSWLPVLYNYDVIINNTLTVAVRNNDGVKNLSKSNINVISPVNIDIELFKEAFKLNLISKFAYEEIQLFYSSPLNWTKELLHHTGNKIVQDIKSFDNIQLSRIRNFIEKDPYGLREEFSSFFYKMEEAIES